MKYDYKKIADLVIKIQSGDEDSFAEIYYLLYPKIYFFSLSILKDVNLAEDIVHDVFIIVRNKISTLKNPKLFIAWINKITYNRCIIELEIQKKQISVNYEDKFKEVKSLEEKYNPELVFEKIDQKNYILKLLDKLSDNHKNLILLKYYSGLKNDEIADVMKIPLGSVKSGLHYAKLNLRKLAARNKMYGILFIPNISYRLNIIANNNIMRVKDFSYDDMQINKANYTKNNISAKSLKFIGIVIGIVFYINFYRTDLSPTIVAISYDNQQRFINKNVNITILIDKYKYIEDIYMIDKNNNKYEARQSNNESYIFNLDKNGEYKVYINGILHKNINIDFIDKENPKVINYTYDKKELHIKIEDNLSKINYDKIYIEDIDGNKININEKDEIDNKIIIDIPKNDLTLFLFDNAGNKSKYKISIKYK